MTSAEVIYNLVSRCWSTPSRSATSARRAVCSGCPGRGSTSGAVVRNATGWRRCDPRTAALRPSPTPHRRGRWRSCWPRRWLDPPWAHASCSSRWPRGGVAVGVGVQKILRRHNLGKRAQRVAALGADHRRRDRAGHRGRGGRTVRILPLRRPSGGARHVLHRQAQGIGPVYQLTAVDTATRYGARSLLPAGLPPRPRPRSSTMSAHGSPRSGSS